MSIIIETMKGAKTEEVPVWIMRQAGRYLPEYRKLRATLPSFMEFCLNPEVVSEATIQPLKRFDLDAAIIFSDILVLPYALGVNVEFHNREGPKLKRVQGIKGLRTDSRILEKVNSALKITQQKMQKEFPNKALIGFAGAPWTVACYMVEGKGSKDFTNVRKFYYSNKQAFEDIISMLTEETANHLINQVKSGAQIIKIFDSWAGILTPDLFEKFVIDPTKKIVQMVKLEVGEIPIIGFAKGAGFMTFEYAKTTGISCVAVDQTMKMSWIRENLGQDIIPQGNLDNALLFSDKNDIEEEAIKILDTFSDCPFIFNLGHGILPETPIESIEHLVKVIKSYKKCSQINK
ncbi:MAG: uroporphyrinogen decarboxylase [Candidatus Midichloria sp.]|uniref:Uroporphyrinogen decarboxylase n=1 Tax=Hyalomma marginatum TaxID=34627 RepID=A0A8S4C451_9ACAR|nr:uroporphyrinogen decarboxylase [Hyalomma marginatum]CAG7595617.1 uroporphyrinogen decarboxylase [Hyalomma marginatum]